MAVMKIEDFDSFKKEVEDAEERILIKFEADWCMPCRAMSSVVEEIAKQYPDIKVIAVDIDGEGMEPVLRQYGVKAVPTFVHVRSGSANRSASGTVSKAELSSLIEDV